jgi:DNA (cytosine-5)-methyltransferase 1
MQEPYKILNLYACLGGNRYKYNEVSENIEVTAVELDEHLAEMYQKRFPNDKVIIADANKFLLNNFSSFDFIHSSPPCPTHSLANLYNTKIEPRYIDLTLYQEIVFLNTYFKGKFCVENVIPYYQPLIPAKKRGRHLYWTNFNLPNILSHRSGGFISGKNELKKLCEFHEIDLTNYKGKQRKDKIARNLVDYEAGKTILETVLNIKKQNRSKQIELF